VQKIEGMLTPAKETHLYADFTKIHIQDLQGNPAIIYAVGWARNWVGTVVIGDISPGAKITAYFMETSGRYIPMAIRGETSGKNVNIGWFFQLGDTAYAVNSQGFAFATDENTVFVQDIPTAPGFAGPWNISFYSYGIPLAVVHDGHGLAQRVYMLNDHMDFSLQNLPTLLPPSQPIGDFETLHLPVFANNLLVEGLPTLAASCGTVLIPYTAATTLIGYGVMRIFSEGGQLQLFSSDGSGAGSLTLVLNDNEAVQFGGRRLPMPLPPMLIDGVVYVPAISLFRGIMPFSNGHILPSRIELYQNELFPQGPHFFANYNPEQAVNLPVFVNGQPINAALQTITDNYRFIAGQGTIYSTILMIELAPVLQSLGYSYSQSDCGEGFYIHSYTSATEWIYTYPVLGRFTRPATIDGRIYVPLFCFFRDAWPHANVAVYDGGIYIGM